MRLRIVPALGTMHLGDITRADVKAFALDLQKAEKSARNIQKTLATISSLFSEGDRRTSSSPPIRPGT